jgi:hypothetical protein
MTEAYSIELTLFKIFPVTTEKPDPAALQQLALACGVEMMEANSIKRNAFCALPVMT